MPIGWHTLCFRESDGFHSFTGIRGWKRIIQSRDLPCFYSDPADRTVAAVSIQRDVALASQGFHIETECNIVSDQENGATCTASRPTVVIGTPAQLCASPPFAYTLSISITGETRSMIPPP